MHCPQCIEELKIAERQGIEIDYCPKCRGVWLDRGELDKIIERSMESMAPGRSSHVSGPSPGQAPPAANYPQQQGDYYHGKKKKKKYKSILEELFDFD